MQGLKQMNRVILLQIVQTKKRSLIVLLMLLFIAAGLQLFITQYQERRVEKLAVEWAKHREEEKRGALQVDRETLYKNGLADLAKFRARVYPKTQFARFIGEIYEMAAKDSLELSSISYKPSSEKDKEEQLLSYAMTLSVSGRYPNLKKFINDLGASNNLLTIDSVAMTASGTSPDAVQLQVLITSFFKVEAQ
jgi:type IV pilus assembly protein PilO